MSEESLTSSEYVSQQLANPGTLNRTERWWPPQQKALEDRGYMLRPRYHADWTPSWKGTKKEHTNFEDGQFAVYTDTVLDATRMSDQALVVLKRVVPPLGEDELAIIQHLSTEPLLSDSRNRCVRLLDVVELPNGEKFMVLPLLHPWRTPKFQTFGEVIAFFDQILEAVHFLHDHNIAHRDCTNNNIMYDPAPMYPIPAHPFKLTRRRDWKARVSHYTRTQKPPKYYLIDFDLARRYDPEDGTPLELPLMGGDKSAPEHRNMDKACDPFATDVYYVGNLMRERFVQKYHGFKFLKPLLADMCCEDPSKRPEIGEAVARFKGLRQGISAWKLRSRIVSRKEFAVVGLFCAAGHVYRTARDIATRKVAIPDP
ncbi:hypothetical protein FA95DRAFT_707815 [Auriscalpium vulgare]|uniref:Uncharacterized protein n=1 Tax=Auriscalpium vulgare TaxID=40419 RepID=A0ACB8RBD1_9AGAM|nr:hypothetical protein FA95DRAFT_707815 [Auriscalpium vulgare]